jgi:hypothetical protein
MATGGRDPGGLPLSRTREFVDCAGYVREYALNSCTTYTVSAEVIRTH